MGSFWLGLTILTVLTYELCAHPGGAPSTACGTMMPSHQTPAQTTDPPFHITVSATTYSSNDAITVTISSPCSTQFKGFLLQARDAEDIATTTAYGSFNTPALSKSIAGCGVGNKVVTHTSRDLKTSMIFQWTAPAASTKHIVFVGTVVQETAIFWTPVYSPVVTLSGAAAFVPPSGIQMPSNTNCPAQVTSGTILRDTTCGSDKSCFEDCQGDKCNFIVSWKPIGGNTEFELRGGLPGNDEWWIALGFSTDNKMGDDGVIECVSSGNTKEAHHSQNNGRQNARVATLTATSISLADKVLTCKLTVPNTNDIFNPKQLYTLLFAYGKTQSGGTGKIAHSTSDLPLVSSEQANLESSTQLIGSSAPSVVLVKTHGTLMIIAWMFFASFGIIVARYYKNLGGSRKWCNLNIWFVLHRSSMVLCFVFATVAFIIIFVDVKGYSSVGKGPDDLKFLQAHPILGIISTCLVFLNPIMAVLRPHPNTPRRPIFNWAHWAVGTAAWIISIVTIFLGFEIEKSGVHAYTKYVLAAFVVYQLLVELLLEFHGCMKSHKNKQATDEYEMHGKSSEASKSDPVSSAQSGTGVFRLVILIAHVIVLGAFLIAIVYMVNNPDKNILG